MVVGLHLVLVIAQLFLVHGDDSAVYKDPRYVKGRTTMIQLFEWKFKDIAEECERFLGPAGIGGVQVSPITENGIIETRPWFERYQPISYRIISRSGNEDDFKDMVSRCNAVGVRIYVDLILNHMTADLDPAVGVDGTTAKPRDLLFPGVPYGPDDFHAFCALNNYKNAVEVRNCSFNGLYDLDQGRDYVRNKIVEFVDRVIDHGIAGVRIDAAKHIWPRDLRIIYGRMKNLRKDIFGPNVRPFIYQEVLNLNVKEAVHKWEYKNLAVVIEFVYSKFISDCFRNQKPLKNLMTLATVHHDLLPSTDSLVMVDNHDNQRANNSVLSHKIPKLYKMAVAFMLAYPYGWPRVMSSYSFLDSNQGPPMDADSKILSPIPMRGNLTAGEDVNDCGNGWVCEHRWPAIYRMIGFRNVVQGTHATNSWTNGDNQIAFSRGNLGFVAFNGQSDTDLKEKLATGLPSGDYCDVISGKIVAGKCTGKTVRVKDDGTAYIEMLKDEKDGVLAIHAQAKL